MAAFTLPNDDDILAEIKKHFDSFLSNSGNIDDAAQHLVQDLIDDAIMSVIFEVDIERKTGLLQIIEGDPEVEKYTIVDAPNVDVLGQPLGKINYECVCPSCNRSLAASRFAPHLEKCMGMGRISSRIASRRIATNASKESTASEGDEADADWTLGTDKKPKKKKDRKTVKVLKESKDT